MYIVFGTCVMFVILNVLYTNYISSKSINIKDTLFNTIIVGASVYGSIELTQTVLPSVGISLGAKSGGGSMMAFTNDPSF